MKNFLKKYLFLVLLFINISCNSNSIYFDIEKQSVVACKGVISRLSIISYNDDDCWFISLSTGKKGSKCFIINEINDDYSIKSLFGYYYFIKDFKLRPETEYEIINHSFGGATGGKLLIRTDNNAVVNYTCKKTCKKD